MKKKILLLVITLFLITGCEPKLTYEINSGKIVENISVDVNDDYSKSKLEDTIEFYGYNKDNGYKYNVSPNSDGYNIKIKGSKQGLEGFTENNNLLNTCYNIVDFNYEKDEKKYYLGTSKGYSCMTYDYMETTGVTITIKTFNKVYDSNADEKGFGTYTWKIDETNYKDSSIMIIVSSNQYVWYYKYRYQFIGLGIVIIIGFLLLIIISIFRRSSKKANEI